MRRNRAPGPHPLGQPTSWTADGCLDDLDVGRLNRQVPRATGLANQDAQASATAATSFCSVSLASPKSMVVLGS